MCVSERSGQSSSMSLSCLASARACLPAERASQDEEGAGPGEGRVAACGTGPLELQGEAEAGAPETELPADEQHIDVLERVEMPDVAADPHVFREEAVHAAAQVVTR
jgi:hypothetical protein